MMAHLMAEGVRTRVTVIPPVSTGPHCIMKPCDVTLHIHAWAASADNVPLIVQVGMLRPEKGHEFMLRVLYQLKMEGKSFRWLVVGAGREEYEARLRQQTEHLGMSGDVLMAGALFPALPVYRIASVVVMPSENEAFVWYWLKRQSLACPLSPVRRAGSLMSFRRM